MKVRRIRCNPETNYFKPRGIPITELEEVILNSDELEALRLADFEGLYQEAAAIEMNISRQTFGNIIHSARRKIADALMNGKAVKIDGGVIATDARRFHCQACQHDWTLSIGSAGQTVCPTCQSPNIFRFFNGPHAGRKSLAAGDRKTRLRSAL
jgi:predicted DNA-binding protein (UPF0251 family)